MMNDVFVVISEECDGRRNARCVLAGSAAAADVGAFVVPATGNGGWVAAAMTRVGVRRILEQ
jgi:hypothetical protein